MIEAGLKEQLSYLNGELSTVRLAGLKKQLSYLSEDLSNMREAGLKGTAFLPQ